VGRLVRPTQGERYTTLLATWRSDSTLPASLRLQAWGSDFNPDAKKWLEQSLQKWIHEQKHNEKLKRAVDSNPQLVGWKSQFTWFGNALWLEGLPVAFADIRDRHYNERK
jgi:hypothetical protein